jgi:hypothetical protein
MLRHQDFAVRALVVDKMSITRGHLKQREPFYQRMVQLVLAHDDKAISDAMLILDESSEEPSDEERTYDLSATLTQHEPGSAHDKDDSLSQFTGR